jgi:glycosyltransferase involved in cell wall biosynthesis
MNRSGAPTVRLAVLLTHPVQYFRPVFAALAQQPGIELLVVFGCDHGSRASLDPDFGVRFAWDSGPTEGFAHRFVSHQPLRDLSCWRRALPLARRAVREIQAFQPDRVLVFAYSPAFITLATLLLGTQGVPLLLRADGTDRAFPRSRFKSAVKDGVLRLWYRQFRHVFPIGSDSDAHFARLGVGEERRHMVRYAVDVAFFAGQVRHWLPLRAALRRQMGVPPSGLVLLWSAKMTEVKNPALLVDALRQLPSVIRDRLWLVAMGDGPLRRWFEGATAELLPGRAHFLGFQNQREVGRGYAVADVLVFPSRQGETWGLVVNEALQFGLAVIASDHPGCVRDLLGGALPVPTGSRVVTSDDVDAMAEAIRSFVEGHPAGFELQPVPGLPKPEDLARAVAAWAGHD